MPASRTPKPASRSAAPDRSSAPTAPLLRRGVRLALATIGLIVLLAVWQLLSADWFSPERLAAQLHALGTSAWGVPIVLAFFVVGSLVVFPVTVLIATTAVVFDPWRGFFLALTGSLLGASAGFAAGRAIGKRLYGTMLGDRIAAVARRLPRSGVLPVLILRNVPIAPFTVFNVAAGVSHIRFIDYLLGTALGMGPAIAALTLLGNRLRDLWQQPSAANVALLGLAVSAWIALALLLQWLSNRSRRVER
jgi:uncharacterized membrane protein YdjX (TVP38/TMEM64 family)